MASYSIEDIELVRSKAGLTYAEAVSMLDYHNGDVAQVLIDLEKRGRLQRSGTPVRAEEKAALTDPKKGSKIMNFIQKLYRIRVKVRKGDTVIVNLSVLYMILAVLLFSPHLAIVSLILGLLLGYQINIDTNDAAFREEKVENIVRSAADNVKQAVSGISREIGMAVEKQKQQRPAPEKETASAPEKNAAPDRTGRSETIHATPVKDPNREILDELDRQTNGPDVPVIRMPIRAESADGAVEVKEEPGGYHTATIG